MRTLESNEFALLELLAIKPISYFPPFHLSIAERMSEHGLVQQEGELWHPTSTGLGLIGRTLH